MSLKLSAPFSRRRGRGGVVLRLAPHYQRDKVFKAFISEGLKCICVLLPQSKEQVSMFKTFGEHLVNLDQ